MPATFEPDLVFAALADATRRDIVLRALNGREGVAELAGHYPMSFAAVQKHVAILERAGLVTKQRLGRRKLVRTDIEGLRQATTAASSAASAARPATRTPLPRRCAKCSPTPGAYPPWANQSSTRIARSVFQRLGVSSPASIWR